jgi:hypothetical protein
MCVDGRNVIIHRPALSSELLGAASKFTVGPAPASHVPSPVEVSYRIKENQCARHVQVIYIYIVTSCLLQLQCICDVVGSALVVTVTLVARHARLLGLIPGAKSCLDLPRDMMTHHICPTVLVPAAKLHPTFTCLLFGERRDPSLKVRLKSVQMAYRLSPYLKSVANESSKTSSAPRSTYIVL